MWAGEIHTAQVVGTLATVAVVLGMFGLAFGSNMYDTVEAIAHAAD